MGAESSKSVELSGHITYSDNKKTQFILNKTPDKDGNIKMFRFLELSTSFRLKSENPSIIILNEFNEPITFEDDYEKWFKQDNGWKFTKKFDTSKHSELRIRIYLPAHYDKSDKEYYLMSQSDIYDDDSLNLEVYVDSRKIPIRKNVLKNRFKKTFNGYYETIIKFEVNRNICFD